jgi:hypothetical protein
MGGDNATSGENQQETARPRLDPMWVVGFVDGEGCFSVSVHRNPYVRQTRGWQLHPRSRSTSTSGIEKCSRT